MKFLWIFLSLGLLNAQAQDSWWGQDQEQNPEQMSKQNVEQNFPKVMEQFNLQIDIDELIEMLPKAPHMGNRRHYDQFLHTCKQALDNLLVSRNQSILEFEHGDRARATQILYQAIHKEYILLQSYRGWDIPPHTAVAIVKAKEILDALFPVINRNLPYNSNDRLSHNVAVKYLVLSELVNLVSKTYLTLDQEYYLPLVDDYFSNVRREVPYRHDSSQLNRNYFDKLKELSLLFLNVQSTTAVYLADDEVELVSAHSFAQAGRELLSKSILRRSFCRPIRKLRVLEMFIEHYLTGYSRIPSRFLVGSVRSYWRDISNDLLSFSPEACR